LYDDPGHEPDDDDDDDEQAVRLHLSVGQVCAAANITMVLQPGAAMA
jgi:hypothetical protein